MTSTPGVLALSLYFVCSSHCRAALNSPVPQTYRGPDASRLGPCPFLSPVLSPRLAPKPGPVILKDGIPGRYGCILSFLAPSGPSLSFASVCREEAGAGEEPSPFPEHAHFLTLVVRAPAPAPKGAPGREVSGRCHGDSLTCGPRGPLPERLCSLGQFGRLCGQKIAA